MKKLIALAAILGLAVPSIGAAAGDAPDVADPSTHLSAPELGVLAPAHGATGTLAEAQVGYHVGTFLIGRYAVFARHGGVVQAVTQGFFAGAGGFIGGYFGYRYGGLVGGFIGAGIGAGIGGF